MSKLLLNFNIIIIIILCGYYLNNNKINSLQINIPKYEIFNDNQWKIVKCFYFNIEWFQIVTLYNQTTKNILPYIQDLLSHLNDEYKNYPFIIKNIKLNYEPLTYRLCDRLAWTGDKLPIRHNQIIDKQITAKNELKSHLVENNVGIILIVESLNVLNEYLYGMLRPPFKIYNGQFIIVIFQKILPHEKLIIEEILERLWKIYVLFRVIIFSTSFPEKIWIYRTFQLAANQNFSNNPKDWGWRQEIDIESDEIDIICERCNPIYPVNLQGFPIFATLYEKYPSAMKWNTYPKSFLQSYQSEAQYYSKEFGGIDGILFGNVAKILNFTVISFDNAEKVGYKNKSGVHIGSVGDVLYSRTSITANLHFITNFQTLDIEFLYPILTDKYCIVTPKSLQIPQSLAVFTIFNLFTWSIILFTIIICGLLWTWFHKLPNLSDIPSSATIHLKRKSSKKISNLWYMKIIDMIIIMTSGTIQFGKIHKYERIFLTGCLMFSIILTGIFQGYLRNAYSQIQYYDEIETLEELDKSGYHIIFYSRLMENLFGENGSDYMMSLSKKMHQDLTFTMNRTAFKRDIGFMQRYTEYYTMKEEYELSDGKRLLNMVSECPRTFLLTYVVRRGWPLVNKFNRVLGLIASGGLFDVWFKWSREATILQIRTSKLTLLQEIKDFKAFDLRAIQLPFFLLCGGYVFSLFVFLLEICWSHCCKKNDK